MTTPNDVRLHVLAKGTLDGYPASSVMALLLASYISIFAMACVGETSGEDRPTKSPTSTAVELVSEVELESDAMKSVRVSPSVYQKLQVSPKRAIRVASDGQVHEGEIGSQTLVSHCALPAPLIQVAKRATVTRLHLRTPEFPQSNAGQEVSNSFEQWAGALDLMPQLEFIEVSASWEWFPSMVKKAAAIQRLTSIEITGAEALCSEGLEALRELRAEAMSFRFSAFPSPSLSASIKKILGGNTSLLALRLTVHRVVSAGELPLIEGLFAAPTESKQLRELSLSVDGADVEFLRALPLAGGIEALELRGLSVEWSQLVEVVARHKLRKLWFEGKVVSAPTVSVGQSSLGTLEELLVHSPVMPSQVIRHASMCSNLQFLSLSGRIYDSASTVFTLGKLQALEVLVFEVWVHKDFRAEDDAPFLDVASIPPGVRIAVVSGFTVGGIPDASSVPDHIEVLHVSGPFYGDPDVGEWQPLSEERGFAYGARLLYLDGRHQPTHWTITRIAALDNMLSSWGIRQAD